MNDLAAVVRVSVIAWLAWQATVPAAGPTVRFAIDASASRVLIDVGKAGLFSFAGHAHEVEALEVRGEVTLDPADWSQSAVTLDFASAGLRVTGAGEPADDVPEVQRVMLGDRVLDAGRFPSIAFRSRKVTVAGLGREGVALRIDGDMTLRGVTRPLSVPATAVLDEEGTLTARGVFTLKQSDFGIEPVTAAGGTIRVKDALGVHFVLVARR